MFAEAAANPEYARSRALLAEWSAGFQGADSMKAEARREEADSIQKAIGIDTLAAQATEARDRCTLATRDYERFMR